MDPEFEEFIKNRIDWNNMSDKEIARILVSSVFEFILLKMANTEAVLSLETSPGEHQVIGKMKNGKVFHVGGIYTASDEEEVSSKRRKRIKRK